MKILITVLLCFNCLPSYSQALEEKTAALLDSFSLANPQEKVYIQTDRSQFIAGETIWFKAYNTLFEKPGILSKVIYVTLCDEQGIVIRKKQLKLVNGTAAGDLNLAADTKPGNYFLKAYTLWMLNYPEFISSKKITVYNTGKNNNSKKTSPIPHELKLKFFPEGGQMVTGLASNIAFKAIDEYNRPVSISGSVIDSKKKQVASFTTAHNGMGLINMTPENGETYTAEINENTPVKNFLLPAVQPEGVTITVDNSNAGKSFVKLERGEKNKEKYNNLLLVAQYNYEVVYTAKINFDEGQDAAAINKKTLTPGIMQITVFTTDGIPLAERCVFVSNYELPTVTNTSINNSKRAKNTIEIDMSAYSNPDVAVSVINSLAETKPAEHNILSELLLSSDIRGTIDEPAWYFKDKSPVTLQHLDLLMMVHGWSRFKWQDVMASKFPPLKYAFETSLSVSGKLTHVDGKSALKSGKVNLIIKGEDSTSIISEATPNSNSDFVVSDLDFKKEATIYYQGTNLKSENALVSVKINSSHMDSLHRLATTTFLKAPDDNMTIPNAMQKILSEKEKQDSAKAVLLEDIVLKSKKISAVDSANRVYTSAIFETSDQTLLMDDGNYFDIWQYLQRMVPGIKIDKTASGAMVNFSRYGGLDFFNNDGAGGSVQFFLNEVPISSDIIDNLNPSDIVLVKVFKGVSGIALGADKGAIAIYTRKGASTTDWRQKGFEFVKKTGYAIDREFYTMDYTRVKPESDFSDIRITLYWNPHIKITNGKAMIEFYNDDISKESKLIIEGIDANGKLFSIEKTLR